LHDTRISNTGLNGAVEFFSRLQEAGLRVIVIGGNHDEAGAPNRFNALHLLRRHGVELYLQQAHVDVCGLRLHLMPFRVLARALLQRGEVTPFQFAPGVPNVLVAHGYTVAPGMASPPEEVNLPEQWLTEPRFDLVCLGHIHRHFQVPGLPKVFYSGAVERRDFGERDETPGFWMHEIDDEGKLSSSLSVTVESLGVEMTPRPMHQYQMEARELSTDALYERVQTLLADEEEIAGSMTRIVLSNVSTELDRSRSRSQWVRTFRAAGGFYLDIVSQTRRVVELLDFEFVAPPVDIAGAFQEFLGAQQYESDTDREALLVLGAEVMAEAHEKLLSQESE
jgi:DNA repair exonuclease SbcCD nuclease subunit